MPARQARPGSGSNSQVIDGWVAWRGVCDTEVKKVHLRAILLN
jgi:hypothetical protein